MDLPCLTTIPKEGNLETKTKTGRSKEKQNKMTTAMKLKEKSREERLCEETGSHQIRDVTVAFPIARELKSAEIHRFGHEN